MAEPKLNTDDAITTRMRGRINPLESAQDFRAYRGARLGVVGDDIRTVSRALIHLPPMADGMSEHERAKLIQDYEKMLAGLSKLETDLKSEEAKTARNRQTMWANGMGDLLEYMASVTKSKADTIGHGIDAAAKQLDALGEQQELFGTAGIEGRVLTAHGAQLEALRGTMGADGNIADTSKHTQLIGDMLKNAGDPRNIPVLLEMMATVTGKDADVFITQSDALFAGDAALLRTMKQQRDAGAIAYQEAATKQLTYSAETMRAMKTLQERSAGVPGYLQEVLKLHVLGSVGFEVPDSAVAKSLGLSPESYATYTTGQPEMGPDGTVVRKGESRTTDPFIQANRDRIIAQIEGMMKGSSPYHVMLKKAMLASPAFKTFKDQTGMTGNEDVIFNAWGEAAIHHERTSARDTRLEKERAILRGDLKVGILSEMGARIGSSFRDLFGGKKGDAVQPVGVPPVPGVIASAPGVDMTVSPPVSAGVPKNTAPGAEPAASEEGSAAVVGGSAPTSTKVETAGGAKSAPEKTTEYRIVNDPRNPDFMYRQYADGRLELIGSPNDSKVSPKNPKGVTGSGKTKLDNVLGAYEKPLTDNEKLRASTEERLDLDDTSPASPYYFGQTDRNKTLGGQQAGVVGLDIEGREGISRAARGDIKLGSGGPGLSLSTPGDLIQKRAQEKLAKRAQEELPEIESEAKGEIDMRNVGDPVDRPLADTGAPKSAFSKKEHGLIFMPIEDDIAAKRAKLPPLDGKAADTAADTAADVAETSVPALSVGTSPGEQKRRAAVLAALKQEQLDIEAAEAAFQ